MTRSLRQAPTAEEVAAVECLFRRVELVNEVADAAGTVPGPLARIRDAALVALTKTHSFSQLARRFGRSRSWVYHHTRRTEEAQS